MNIIAYNYPANLFQFFFRSPPGKMNGNKPKIKFREEDQAEKDIDRENFILCKACNHKITTYNQMISVRGSHQHTFANPNGIVFDIGCYKTAPGCLNTGPLTDEFSWFKGYRWRVSVCASCLAHLGWLFVSSTNDFFSGLIIDRLINSN